MHELSEWDSFYVIVSSDAGSRSSDYSSSSRPSLLTGRPHAQRRPVPPLQR